MNAKDKILVICTLIILLSLLITIPILAKSDFSEYSLHSNNQEVALEFMKNSYTLSEGIIGFQTNQLIYSLFNGQVDRSVRKERAVLGFYVGDEPEIPSSYGIVKNQHSGITAISPFWYRLELKNPQQLELFGPVNEEEIQNVNSLAKKNNVQVYALVHNLLYGSTRSGKEVARQALMTPGSRRELTENIIQMVTDNGFDGVCVDIENIYSNDKGKFVLFLERLYKDIRLSGHDLDIIVTVPAKTSDNLTGGWGDNFDYDLVGKYADMVTVMAYDEHGSFSGPGPIASRDWVENVVRYTLTKLPANKVMLGIPGYGFDWNIDSGGARYVSYPMAKETAVSHNKDILWHQEFGVPYYSYNEAGEEHEVFFENARSMAHKLDEVNRYDLRGIAIWRLGMEDPDSWNVISSKFNVRKAPADSDKIQS